MCEEYIVLSVFLWTLTIENGNGQATSLEFLVNGCIRLA